MHRDSETFESPRIVYNPALTRFATPTGDPDALAFHRKLPGYSPTPLVAAPGVAAKLGVRQVWVKDESNRLGLPAYKILGGVPRARYAIWAVRIVGDAAGARGAVAPIQPTHTYCRDRRQPRASGGARSEVVGRWSAYPGAARYGARKKRGHRIRGRVGHGGRRLV
jgi:hypothetical protein